MRLFKLAVPSLVFTLSSLAASAQLDARLVQEPAVSATQIAFAYAGDIWVMPKSGGAASRLTTAPGQEHYPRFSPDGKQIAFTGNYDGNEDLYVVPAAGGEVRRVTHHPAPDRMLGWFPDGRSLLFASPMMAGLDRYFQLFRVSAEGGLPERLPVPYGEFGAVSEDGTTLAYCPNSQDLRTWKRYRGGDVSRIWLFDLSARTSRRVGDDGANYSQPMWHGATLYVLSDRDEAKRNNIWAFDTKTGAWRAVTRFTQFDVRFPSIGPSDLVFENGGRLYRIDLATESATEVSVQVVTDAATLRPRTVKVGHLIQAVVPSPTGKRVAVQARGEIFSVPSEHGPTLNLTRTPSVAERYPAWSPDGKTLAYWSDRTGEYELTVRPADGSGAERTVTRLGPGYRYALFFSPDSKKVAFVDQAMVLRWCDIATGAVTAMDRGLWLYDEVQDNGHESLAGFAFSWSPDSRFVAWSREVENRMGALFVHDTRTARTTQLTAGFYYDFSPAFDPGGKYLYYLTRRTFNAVYSDLDVSWIYANGTQLAAVPLRAGEASPLAPRDDQEPPPSEAKGGDAKAGEGGKPVAKADGLEKPPAAVTLEPSGFESRAVLLPPAAGNYSHLSAVSGKVLFLKRPLEGAPEGSPTALTYYDIEKREEKTILDDVDGYEPAAGGEKLLVSRKEEWVFVPVEPEQKFEKPLATGDLEMVVVPRAEWRQIFSDAWRFERDFFYDPKMHGVDWTAMRARYGALVDQCATRWDVNVVLGDLIGELSSSHTYRGGGDAPHAPSRGVGLLGCDFALEGGAYRIAKIYAGAPWDVEARSPLSEPGAGVKEGEYLLAVDGVPVDPKTDPWAAFDGLADKVVQLTVNAKPTEEGARRVLVKTLEDEERLRNLAWIEANRLRVEKATGGRVGYLYVPDTMYRGQRELYRQFMGQITKPALVIDERFNSGGQIPDRFIELLNRPVTNYWAVRDGRDWAWPEYSHTGPKVMLINGWSGSGGDCFPYYFREAKLGPLVGRRTWGGLIGISGSPGFVDGGGVTVPTFRFYTPEGKWDVEGRGVEPDVDVVDDPALMQDGADPQLDRAVAEAMRLLEVHPPAKPARPANPDRPGH